MLSASDAVMHTRDGSNYSMVYEDKMQHAKSFQVHSYI